MSDQAKDQNQDAKSKNEEPASDSVERIVLVLSGCNVNAAKRLADKMDDGQKERLQDAHRQKRGRSTLLAIRTEITDAALKAKREEAKQTAAKSNVKQSQPPKK